MSSNQQKEAVGQGLKSLLKNIGNDVSGNPAMTSVTPNLVLSQRIPLNKIQVNPNQPRKDFNEQELQELANSIKLHDIIQPITLSKLGYDTYQIISGERRFRAAQLAGLKDIPAYIRTVQSKQNLIELALLENLQRSDLNAIEIALSYQQLINECNLTHEVLAERMSKDRSTITNHLRLLKLPPDIQIAVRNNTLSMGHARCISGLEDIDKQLYVANRVMQEKLSVRDTEDLIKTLNNKKENSKTTNEKANKLSPLYKKIEDNLAASFNARIEMNHNEKTQKGTITFHYFNNENLNQILDKLGVTIN